VKAQSQAIRLSQMMQHLESKEEAYEIILEPFYLTELALKTLEKNKILLLNLEALTCFLVQKEKCFAKVICMYENEKYFLKVLSIDEPMPNLSQAKGYMPMACSLFTLKTQRFSLGDKIEISMKVLANIDLFVSGKLIAKAFFVKVEEKIALQIKKVIYE
jgi:hypothetical protein